MVAAQKTFRFLKTDGGATYTALTCTDCTGTSQLTSSIVVDGNTDGANQADCQCLSGDTCTLIAS